VVDSISKTRTTAAQVEAIVAAAFDADSTLAASVECEEGWFNAVHRLELADGSRWILKIAPPPDVRVLRYEHDLVTTEVEALRLVRARTDLPVPEVRAFDASCTIVASPWFVMSHCAGRLLSEVRPSLDADAQAHVDAQLARHLAAMHAITAPAFGRPDAGATQDATWSRGFARLVDDLLADAVDADVELPIPPSGLAELIGGRAVALDEVTEPRLVHWDLWDTNVFVDEATLEVVGLIDFERVLWADPLMEAQFAGVRQHSPIVDAYGERLFDEPGAVARRQLYDLYLYLVMTVECAYRNYPTDDIEDLARPMLAVVIDELQQSRG